jgi:hypothetical protein
MPINRSLQYNYPSLDREYNFANDLINLLSAMQNGKCGQRQFRARVRQYVRDTEMAPNPFVNIPVTRLRRG